MDEESIVRELSSLMEMVACFVIIFLGFRPKVEIGYRRFLSLDECLLILTVVGASVLVPVESKKLLLENNNYTSSPLPIFIMLFLQ